MDMDMDDSTVSNHRSLDSAPRSINPSAKPEDTFKILLASDIHLGVHEKDPIRGEDSFITFEEILKTANEKKVDFVLLAGDLFHDSKPSQACYVKAISLIRQYTFGDKAITMCYKGDPKEAFHNSVIGDVNYQDPNQNVSYPIFSIHGNHDDPSGFQRTSALDVVSAAGQLNYFGVCQDLTKVVVKPIKLQQGRTKLALYGISHIRDERLSRLMASGAVKYEQPFSKPDEWFKILVLHQNRVARTGTKHIEDKWIPAFFDLVIWGHEHECLITPQKTMETDKNFYNIQPGSPVATSLCEPEAVEKKIGVLNVCLNEFKLDEIKLKTVRPFVFHTESAKGWSGTGNRKEKGLVDNTKKFIKNELLPLAEKMLSGHPKQPTLPLIRLRLEIDSSQSKFNEIRFGQQNFTDIVANPNDMIMFKTPFSSRPSRKDNALIDAADLEDLLDTSEIKAEALAPQFFEHEENRNKQLQVLSIAGLCEAVTTFVEKDDKGAIFAIVEHQVEKTIKFLKEQDELTCDKSVISNLIGRFKDMRANENKEEEAEHARSFLDSDTRWKKESFNKKAFKETGQRIASQQSQAQKDHALSDDEVVVSDDDIPFPEEPVPPKRGRGRGRGASSRASNVSVSSRASTTSNVSTSRRGRGAANASFKATGRSLNATNGDNGPIQQYFKTRKAPDDASDSKNPFDDFNSTPKKKARIQYASDSD